MNRLIWVAALAAALTACSSGVKLNDVPVEDKTGAAVTPGTADGSGVSQRPVAAVDLDKERAKAFMTGTNRMVYFDYDSYVIKSEFQSVVEAHAKFLSGDKSRKIAIEGHTDERGGREYNLALGQRRAEAVRRALGLLGVADNQMEAVSFGKEKPAVQGSTEEAMAKNRRAEIVYR